MRREGERERKRIGTATTPRGSLATRTTTRRLHSNYLHILPGIIVCVCVCLRTCTSDWCPCVYVRLCLPASCLSVCVCVPAPAACVRLCVSLSFLALLKSGKRSAGMRLSISLCYIPTGARPIFILSILFLFCCLRRRRCCCRLAREQDVF